MDGCDDGRVVSCEEPCDFRVAVVAFPETSCTVTPGASIGRLRAPQALRRFDSSDLLPSSEAPREYPSTRLDFALLAAREVASLRRKLSPSIAMRSER